jgi:hypothetical protein
MVLSRRRTSLEILSVVVFSKIHRDCGTWKVALFYFYRPSSGLGRAQVPYPRLTPWVAFCRREAAGFCGFRRLQGGCVSFMANLLHASDYGRRLRIDNFF